jgi:hypothetical protein
MDGPHQPGGGENTMTAKTVLVSATAGAVVVSLLALPGALALDKPGTVQITDTELRHAIVDGGRTGRSAGDVDIYSLRLFNKRITPRAIGHGEMVCTAVGIKNRSCTASYFLPRGEIVAQGVITSKLIYELAVIGGTGLYSNVRGSVTITSLHRKPSRELLVFRLVV